MQYQQTELISVVDAAAIHDEDGETTHNTSQKRVDNNKL